MMDENEEEESNKFWRKVREPLASKLGRVKKDCPVRIKDCDLQQKAILWVEYLMQKGLGQLKLVAYAFTAVSSG